MNSSISPNDFVELMQDCFSRGQTITFTPSGNSMLPMLDGKSDMVTFSPAPKRLKKYDVAFYRRPKSGQLVLHRLIGFTKSGEYIFCGDNQYAYEYGIGDKDVLALMVSFTHKGQEYSVDRFAYRFYIRRMLFKKRVRRFLSKTYHFLTDRFRRTSI